MTHLLSLRERMDEKDRVEAEAQAAAVAFFGASRHHRPARVKATVPRPTCARCSKVYGERAERYWSKTYAVGEPIEPYAGDAHLVEEIVVVGGGLGPSHGPGARATRRTWDGVTYVSRSGTEPFCSGRCALAFARDAHKAGFRYGR